MEKEYSIKYLQINRERRKTVIFDSTDLPSYSVMPSLSDLAESDKVGQEFQNQYPDILFSRSCLADGAVIIQNILSQNNQQIIQEAKELNNTSNLTIQIVDAEKMTDDLLTLLSDKALLNEETLLIFPGNGAEDVLKQLSFQYPAISSNNSEQLSTKRTLIRPGVFDLSVDYSPLPSGNFGDVIIIDDVIASGQTASTIAYTLKEYFPFSRISLAAWMMLPPTMKINKQSSSGVGYVDRTIVSTVLKGNYMGRPPVNSLSGLIDEGETSKEKLRAYKGKYISDEDEFTSILERIKLYT